MKGIINVSIAGIAFKLEDEAYGKLDDYLARIRRSYGDSPEGREILDDIEARIAEIILTQQDASVVVPLALIESIIQRLGAPEDISEGAEGKKPEPAPVENSGKRIPHRLYRNPEGAKLGGVCSGLAAYFNMDAVWIRLLFAAPLVLLIFFAIIGWGWLVPTITGFMTTAFILYFLLWIVIPKARTPLQKLEMKGETITRDKLEQTFREEFQSRNNSPQNIELRARNERNASVFSEFVSIVGKILLFCAKALVAIIGFGFAIAIVSIVVALLFVVVGGSGAIQGITATSPALLVALIGLAVIIPLSLAVYGILKMLFGFNHSRPFITTLLVIWVLTLVFGTVIFIKDYDNIRFGNNISIGWDSNKKEWRDTEGSRANENSRFERWIDDVELEGVKELTRTKRLGNYNQMGIWNVLQVSADTLFVAPMDSVQMPDSFVVKIRRGHPKYPEPTLIVLKSYKGKEEKRFDPLLVEHRLQGDTLLLRAVIPDIADVSEEKIDAELFVPEHMAVVVDGKIGYNEYYNN